MSGELLTRCTIWVALVCCFSRLALELTGWGAPGRRGLVCFPPKRPAGSRGDAEPANADSRKTDLSPSCESALPRRGLVCFPPKRPTGIGGHAEPAKADSRKTDLSPSCEAAMRAFWTMGCVFLWLHVACAFRFYHHWSHAAAYEQTARETAAVTGLDWGGGVWLNYALMVLWAADVAWWWIWPASFRARPRLIEWTWQASFAFIVFNATVVFEDGLVRLIALGAFALLGAAFALRVFRRRSA